MSFGDDSDNGAACPGGYAGGSQLDGYGPGGGGLSYAGGGGFGGNGSGGSGGRILILNNAYTNTGTLNLAGGTSYYGEPGGDGVFAQGGLPTLEPSSLVLLATALPVAAVYALRRRA